MRCEYKKGRRTGRARCGYRNRCDESAEVKNIGFDVTEKKEENDLHWRRYFIVDYSSGTVHDLQITPDAHELAGCDICACERSPIRLCVFENLDGSMLCTLPNLKGSTYRGRKGNGGPAAIAAGMYKCYTVQQDL